MSRQKSAAVILVTLIMMFLLVAPGASAASSVATASLIGMVYHDLDCDGAYGLTVNGMETSLSGVPVSLYLDQAPYGVLGIEDGLIESRATNIDGYVVFPGISTGRYLLNVKTPAGYLALTPSTQEVGVDGEAAGTMIEWMFGLTTRSSLPVRRYLPTVGG